MQESTAVHQIPLPTVRFAHVHVDLVGPLPVSAAGHSHLLTVVDRCTRWPEAIPMRSTTAEDCADAFVEHWVARFGVPHTITTDRGPQFTSAVWKCLCKTIGTRHILTTAYHPQSNGMVERFHRQLKDALRARGSKTAWLEHLPWALLHRSWSGSKGRCWDLFFRSSVWHPACGAQSSTAVGKSASGVPRGEGEASTAH